MKRICIFLTLLLLAGCSAPDMPDAAASPAPTATAMAGETAVIQGEIFQIVDGRAVEPDCTIDIARMTAQDFGDLFIESYPTERETVRLDDGTAAGTEATVLRGAGEGATVYVVGGLHGDERAGWFAGLLLKDVTLKAGTLCVIAPANASGAEKLVRVTADGYDLNRNFPGSPDGVDAKRIAHAIYSDIQRVKPAIVLDLHEAIYVKAGRDFLGSTMIYTKLDGMSELFMDLYLESQAGQVTSVPFGYAGPSPENSINRTVTDALGIPCITVETFRGYPIERRVADQLAIVEFVLEYYGLR